MTLDMKSQFRGCLLGGAVGDALGAPVEFMSRNEILSRFGPTGVSEYAPAYGGIGCITDDTQMTLFTAEGLLRSHVRGCLRGVSTQSGLVSSAYERWLYTQGELTQQDTEQDWLTSGWLIKQQALHSRRAPGMTCLSALKQMRAYGDQARNDSKGCGGVMRVAPVGLFAHASRASFEMCFELGVDVSALTHGHATGQLAGGVLAVMIQLLVVGESLSEALGQACQILKRHPRHEETLTALELATVLLEEGIAPNDAIARLGQGWIAEEALAISVYCAMKGANFRDAIEMAINHDGDSDSTGAITGNLLGAMLGEEVIPASWHTSLELREVISEMADDLHDCQRWEIYTDGGGKDEAWAWEKYPGY
ncbi:ADP-ribosylglycohydrolase family protein [Cobetia crustatorum]|uniref:ADP-ribosylglycohydrolase family protein n=1 Tax=Cobetia crustatorum TaxID=553385 RepID=UPI0004BADAC0|nr:ADP-ribosylglycohydrolase family protein [Cobetia crustatorum]